MHKILIVDDEPSICLTLKYLLEKDGFEVKTAGNGLIAWQNLQRCKPHIVILDVQMPEMNGNELCLKIRADACLKDVYIIMLTALSDEENRVTSFCNGADDHVSKPFSITELLLRVKAATRRIENSCAEPGYSAVSQNADSQVAVMDDTNELIVSGQKIILRPKERKLLYLLITNYGKTFSREELLETVWDCASEIDTNVVDMTFYRIRSKLKKECPSLLLRLRTVTGQGYRWE